MSLSYSARPDQQKPTSIQGVLSSPSFNFNLGGRYALVDTGFIIRKFTIRIPRRNLRRCQQMRSLGLQETVAACNSSFTSRDDVFPSSATAYRATTRTLS